MKKLILSVLATGLVAQAGVFSTISGMAMDERKPTYAYTIDTAGVNPRIYEFTPKSASNKICVAVFISNGAGGSAPALQCFDKKPMGI